MNNKINPRFFLFLSVALALIVPSFVFSAGSVKVYLIDTGADANINYASKTSVVAGVDPTSQNGHGAIVAKSFLEGFEQYGGQNAEIHSINYADASGNLYADNATKALRTAIDAGADVVNVSSSAKIANPAWNAAMAEADAKGVIVVISSGNQGDQGTQNALISTPSIVSVGALERYGEVATYSNGVTEKSVVDIYEYGERLGANGIDQGTSFASPRVAGAIAALVEKTPGSADTNGNGRWDAAEAKAKLAQGIADGTYEFKSGGRLAATTPGATAQNPAPGDSTSGARENPQNSNGPAGAIAPFTGTTFQQNGQASYSPLEPLPGISSEAQNGSNFPALVSGIFRLLITFGGLFAVVMLVIAGIGYMVSESAVDISKAKDRAKAALWGLVLLTACWLILYTINPKLTQFDLLSSLNTLAGQQQSSGGPLPASTQAAPTNDQIRTCENNYGRIKPNPDGGFTCI